MEQESIASLNIPSQSLQQVNPITIQDLPIEDQVAILSNIDRQDLLNTCMVNKYWDFICHDQLLWKRLYLNDFGPRNFTENPIDYWKVSALNKIYINKYPMYPIPQPESWYELYKEDYDEVTNFVKDFINRHQFIYSPFLNKSELIPRFTNLIISKILRFSSGSYPSPPFKLTTKEELEEKDPYGNFDPRLIRSTIKFLFGEANAIIHSIIPINTDLIEYKVKGYILAEIIINIITFFFDYFDWEYPPDWKGSIFTKPEDEIVYLDNLGYVPQSILTAIFE